MSKIITSTISLERACSDLAKSEFITVDTEFLRDNTFWPQLCLIQMASPSMEFLVDPLSTNIDLSPFFDLISNPSIIKVFHSARQDIEIIFHMCNRIPTPIFDTQIAAMVCGFKQFISYDHLVLKITGHKIDKSLRFTKWNKRPLSPQQIGYGLADVTYLREVYLKLKNELQNNGRTEWIKEKIHILIDPKTYDISPDTAWEKFKMNFKKPQELSILKYIATWRENEARSRNVPRNRILKNEILFEIVQKKPKSLQDLEDFRTIHREWIKSPHSAKIIQIVKTALALPIDKMPKPSSCQKKSLIKASARTDLLKVLLNFVCEKHGVTSNLIV
ncbi:ribonuclease D, partial [Candidatus Liberibacter sp.]|uniref:ribonuclease D n=1 Tax=Candidatus Liberibacter sp. TaxID=34022 RepID=UPI0015F42485